MKIITSLALALALTLTACGGGEDATQDTTTTTAPAEPELVVTMIEPPDTAGYLDGIHKREPDLVAQFDEAELVELGPTACSVEDDQELADILIDRGHQPDVSEDMAGAMRNASRDTFCTVAYTTEEAAA